MTTTTTPTPTLRAWLDDLRDRGTAITIHAGTLTLTGPIHPHDAHQLNRHTHALLLAAADTHTDWWHYAIGRTHTPPAPDQIPTVADPTTADGVAYACACCGQPADHLTPELLPFCDDHNETNK